MGLHNGPVYTSADINANRNVAGGGINIAQRVMNAGDAGHILLSQAVAETLMQLSEWRGCVKDLGECEVKHGVRLRIYNLVMPECGNADTPSKFCKVDHTGDREVALSVLPFKPVPQGPEGEALADGLISEIIQALGGVPQIRVARLAAAHFADSTASLEVGSRLPGVTYILSGTIRHAAGRMRVLCELADTAHATRHWSRTYQSSAPDPFDGQEEVARSIAADVSGALLTISARGAGAARSGKLGAADLVRRAHRAVFAAYGRAEIEEASSLVREAIALAPNYGPAYGYLGLYLQQRVINGFSPDPDQDRAEALQSVERALQLAPADTEVLQNAGLVFVSQSRTERAIGVLRRAVEIAEFNLVAWGYLGLALGWSGGERDIEESQAIFDRVIRVTPDHPSMPYWLYFKAGTCFRQGKHEEALECARRCVERQPQFLVGLLSYANALGLAGRFSEAMEVVGRVLALSPGTGQQQYIGELKHVVCTDDRVRPHIAGLIAAGIFTGV